MQSLELLSKISLITVKTHNFKSQMNNILSLIGKYSNVSRTYIFINNEDNTITNNEFEWCNTGISPVIHFFQNRALSDIPSLFKILNKEGKLFSTNIENLPEDLYKIFISQNIKSLIIYPLYINNKIFGFVGYDECIVNRNWTEEDLNILATISGIISNLYKNHYYLKKIEDDKHYFENFFNTITDYIIIGNMKGKIIYANKATIDKLGYSINELLDMNIIELHPKNKRDEASSILNQMFIGDIQSCPLELISKTNIIIPVETRVWFGKWNNEDCIFGISKDLSKEQEALQKFTKIFKNNPALMALCNMDDKKFVDVNTSFLNKLGYSYNEVIGKTSSDLKLFPDPEKHEKTTDKLTQSGEIKNIELKVRCKDDSILYGIFSGEVIESQGKQYYLTVMIDATEKKIIEQQLEELSIRDSLTNIYNRRYIFNVLENYLNKFINGNQIFSITILDIDFFKEINDTHGHVIGDYVLIEFTKMISKFLTPNQILGRYGGEEFIIISPDEYKKTTATQINNILNEINKTTFNINNIRINLSFSAGISDTEFFEKDNITIEKIINISDERLYKAKRTGRNKVVYLDN
ncbi:MAG: diguanylate cyclase [Spirochaetia bacterium]|nr:diguanylate cyclase [Spirochaetia bacterium]